MPAGPCWSARCWRLAVPLPELRLLLRQRSLGVYAPYAVMLACLLYGWALSAFRGDLFEATITGLKSFIPPLYAMVLIQRPDDSEPVLRSAARAFIFVGPVIGVYGIVQYLSLPDWDRYWMLNSPRLTSIGKPEPFGVRVFSTMNSPASFATFATCGVLLFGFCKRGWLSVLLVVPLCIALLLSAVRTAWIIAVIGIVYGCFFHATRGRSVLLTLFILGAIVVVLLTPYGDLMAERLATLGTSPVQDGSGQERIREYVQLYTDMDRYLLGNGLAGTRAVDPKMLGIDGQTGRLRRHDGHLRRQHPRARCRLGGPARAGPRRSARSRSVWLAAAAIVLGNIVVLPLIIVASGEVSFPVWMFIALLTARPRIAGGSSPTPRPRRIGAGPSRPATPARRSENEAEVRCASFRWSGPSAAAAASSTWPMNSTVPGIGPGVDARVLDRVGGRAVCGGGPGREHGSRGSGRSGGAAIRAADRGAAVHPGRDLAAAAAGRLGRGGSWSATATRWRAISASACREQGERRREAAAGQTALDAQPDARLGGMAGPHHAGRPRFRRLVAVSKRVRDELVRFYGVPLDRIALIPNGVNTERFRPDPGTGPGCAGSSAFPTPARLLLFAGHEFERKGLSFVIEALALLPPDVHLLVVGAGDAAPYRAQADRLGVGARVAFAGSRPDLPRIYPAGDVFVFPTYYESFALVCMEAMSSGLPLFATRVGGIEDYLEDGGNGYFIERDPADIAAKLRPVLDDPATLRSLGARRPPHRGALRLAADRGPVPPTCSRASRTKRRGPRPQGCATIARAVAT